MNRHEIRVLERGSIRSFVESHRNLLIGRVLDFGSGPQPYRDLIFGEYVPYEKGETLPRGLFDSILCTQVMEYVDEPERTIGVLWTYLRPGGYLLLTYPTLWEEVETEDKWRFTKRGMEYLVEANGFTVIEHEERCHLSFEDFILAIGYGLVCRK